MTGDMDGKPCEERNCRGHYHFNKYCGAFVCDSCGDHAGLGQCFCGWNLHKADPEATYQEGWFNDT